METMQERILDKVQKLLALTEARGATPEEAASAAAKAQALLFEHHLTLAQVEANGHNGEKKEGYDKTYFVLNATKFSLSWHRCLLSGICKANFAKAIYGQGAKASIIGRKSDVEVIAYLYQYVSREIDRLADVTRQQEGVIENKRRWKTSFCYGAAATVCQRLNETRATQAAATPASQALVVMSAEDLKRAVNGYFPHLRNIRGGRISNTDGYYHGQTAGRNISIRPGMGQTPNGQLALN
jgi:hypothetical protein